jgi:hypothetical protein
MLLCSLFEWKQICANFLSFIYICILVGDPIIKRGGWAHIYQCNPTLFYMLVPSQDLDFQHHMSCSFLCSVGSVKVKGDCFFC